MRLLLLAIVVVADVEYVQRGNRPGHVMADHKMQLTHYYITNIYLNGL